MGVLVVLLASPLFLSWPLILLAVLKILIASLIIILFVIDLKTMLLPDTFVVILTVAVVVYMITNYKVQITNYSAQSALGGAALGAGFLLAIWTITRGRGVGLGDVKLMIPFGVLFGLLGTGVLLWLAYITGGLWAVALLLRRQATLKTAVPFGPFLCGAALLLLVRPELPAQLVTRLLGYNPWM